MDKPSKDIHSLIGNLAHVLKRCTIPKPNIVIDEDYVKSIKSVSTQGDNKISNENVGSQSFHNYNKKSEIATHSRPVINISRVHSGKPVKSDSSQNNKIGSLLSLLDEDSDLPTFEAVDVEPSEVFQGYTQMEEIPQPNRPIITLSNDGETLSSSTIENSYVGTGTDDDITNQLKSSENLDSGSKSVKIPEFLKVPASIFPLYIGSETYLLPYQDNDLKLSLALHVLSAHGEFVVAKAMGYSHANQNTEFGGDVILTPRDAIQSLPVATPLTLAEMTIAEQLTFHNSVKALKERAAQLPSDNPSASTLVHTSIPTSSNSNSKDQLDTTCNVEKEKSRKRFRPEPLPYTKYLDIKSGLIGTVVRCADDANPGLISYELNDGFSNTLYQAENCSTNSQMVGGETVEFDLALNCETKKCEAVRVKLAPLNVNLKNKSVNRNIGKQTRTNTRPRKSCLAPEILTPSPPTIFTSEKILKEGLVGLVFKLPSEHRPGAILLQVGSERVKVAYRQPSETLTLSTQVKFDLSLWFKAKLPPQATNIENVHKKTKDLPMYEHRHFLFEATGCRKPWTIRDFRALLVALKEDKKKYEWKKMSDKIERSQADIQNTTKFIISQLIKIEKSSSGEITEGSFSVTKSRMDLFVDIICDRISSYGVENTSPTNPRSRKPSSPRLRNKSTEKSKISEKNKTKEKALPKPTIATKKQVKTVYKRAKRGCKSDIADDLATPSGSSTTSKYPLLSSRESFVARNLNRWSQVAEVPGDRAVNSVLSDVMSACSEQADATNHIDYPKIYKYLGVLLQNGGGKKPKLPQLSVVETTVVMYLLQSLFSDIAKRNLHTHKQFLLQRFFDITGNRASCSSRTPINPFKLKGFLLNLPDPSK